MQKLSLPAITSNESYSACVAGIVDDDLRASYEEEASLIESVAEVHILVEREH